LTSHFNRLIAVNLAEVSLVFLTWSAEGKKIFGEILLTRKTRRWIVFSEDDAKRDR
jgi:hypothetical protein